MIKAYILDFNGIFVQSEYTSNRLHEKWNVPIEESLEANRAFLEIARLPNAPDMFSIWKPYLERWKIIISEADFLNWWFEGETVQRDVVLFCQKVRGEGKKVFILSNNFIEKVKYYKKNYPKIFENVDKAYFSWETGFLKPNVEAIQNVLNDNKLKAEEVVYVDDSLKNLESARNIGIQSYGSFMEIQDLKL